MCNEYRFVQETVSKTNKAVGKTLFLAYFLLALQLWYLHTLNYFYVYKLCTPTILSIYEGNCNVSMVYFMINTDVMLL